MPIVEFQNVTRIYSSGDHEQKALDSVNLALDEGKLVVILGPSGAGKSTLLNLLGGLDSPTSGKITVCGRDISTLTKNELADYRAETVGFVFQFYNLIPTLTVHENVALVKEIASNPLSATKMLEEVGLADHAKNFPSELSGGERQRISIARAFLKDAPIILMDEATASLDVDNESLIQESISKLIRNKTVLIIAHRMRTVDGVDKIVVLKDGKVAEMGSPDALRAENGIYKHMIDTQVKTNSWKY